MKTILPFLVALLLPMAILAAPILPPDWFREEVELFVLTPCWEPVAEKYAEAEEENNRDDGERRKSMVVNFHKEMFMNLV